ncbi:hypothetical protein BpHYR1_025577 [Brachionus plicatilis]|uniref:Uncharacterized protein n=1 Tax=Brachionus plicatilis TaxID=10195 RepID=A0A3M7S4Y2_BRAPC|nr:hypothetical protein BpHYR1_025577 [Brachionus plicatilis]
MIKHKHNQFNANNSFFGLVLTILCAVIIIIAGCLFCLVIKRKYGLNAPNYLLNFKNSFFLKPSNLNLEVDSNCKMAKKSRTFQYHHQYQQQQYQLEPSKRSNLPSANIQKTSVFNPVVKPHSFSYNYVILFLSSKSLLGFLES